MKNQNINPVRFLYLSFLSFFGVGFSPKAPGTVGSLATIPLIYAMDYYHLSFATVAISTIILTFISCLVAHYAQIKENVHDPGWIVIDEVIGMLVTWLFIFPVVNLPNIILLFVFFRFFDIVKVWPANWCDKNIKNGAGTIIDDVISGIYAGVCLFLVNFFQLTV
ncbi:MAG: phosphatidylglycerophosphatase A [Flavobacteriaceae bacterium]|nr:phosphatidylglycerophosphatase A [Flavobacteriaceae bacterium]